MAIRYCGILSLDCEHCSETGECSNLNKCESKVWIEPTSEQIFIITNLKRLKRQNEILVKKMNEALENIK